MQLRGKSVRSWSGGLSDRHWAISHFSFQPVLHGVWYPVCGMMHIKEPLLLIIKSSPCGGSAFPLVI